MLSREARHFRPSSLDEATLDRVPSWFGEKVVGDRRADQAGTRRRRKTRSNRQTASFPSKVTSAVPKSASGLFEVALERFGQVDVLVNSAGIFIAKPTVEYSVDDVEQMLSTHLKGFFYPSQEAARHMAACGRARAGAEGRSGQGAGGGPLRGS